MKSQQIIDYIAHGRECTAADITGFSRVQHIADGRAVAQYVLRELGWTWQRIADRFDSPNKKGTIHHASVIHNWNKVNNDNKLKPEACNFLAKIAEYEKELKEGE